MLAVDCEGVQLSRTGALTLVQIATSESPTVFLFDVHSIRERDVLVRTLKVLLEDHTRAKILHDCRRDAEALFYQLGIRINNVIDTQV